MIADACLSLCPFHPLSDLSQVSCFSIPFPNARIQLPSSFIILVRANLTSRNTSLKPFPHTHRGLQGHTAFSTFETQPQSKPVASGEHLLFFTCISTCVVEGFGAENAARILLTRIEALQNWRA